MPFYIISGVIVLNTTFYIRFVFVFYKTYTDYCLILSCLREFYIEDDILHSIFAKTNYKKVLIQTLKIIIL